MERFSYYIIYIYLIMSIDANTFEDLLTEETIDRAECLGLLKEKMSD